jgi:cytochrome c2
MLQKTPIVMFTVLLWLGACQAAEPVSFEDGKRVYERERCRSCHSIDGKGNRRYPLDGVGGRLGPDDIRKWIVAPQEMKPGVKKEAYALSEADLAALLGYMGSLRP